MDKRVKIVANAPILRKASQDLIQKQDKQRASYYNFIIQTKNGAIPRAVILTLDSGKLGIDEFVLI